MEKLKMHSPNLTIANIEKIKTLFPNCVTESTDESGSLKLAVDFDQLRQELSDSIVEGPQERYQLNWPGKREALLTANAPIAKTLRPAPGESVDFENTKNLFIEGDNLEALKLLQETYLGKVKMIYIDPPYNTGKDFIYEDDFAESTEEFLIKSNQKDESGNRLVANTESNGRFHSDWLTMIYPRLKLARSLLSDDGIIFISIDDNEQANLKKMCDEVFGEENFVASFIWEKGKELEANNLGYHHEYVFLYSKNKNLLSINLLKKDTSRHRVNLPEQNLVQGIETEYKNGEFFQLINLSKQDDYDLEIKLTNGRILKRKGYLSPKTLNEFIKSGRIFVGKKETVYVKSFLSDERNGSVASSLIKSEYGTTKKGGIEVKFILGNKFFSYPKPVLLIKHLLQISTNPNDLILDFFAGSSTTAHAVMQLNAEDGGARKFIMAQLPEPCNEKSEAFKAGYKNIAEISKERIRRAGKKILEGQTHEGWNKDVGFRVLKVDSSNMKDVYYSPNAINQADLLGVVDNIKPERKPEDLLFQVLLDWGVDLSLSITKQNIQGKTVFFVNQNPCDLVACFDKGITEELVKEIAKTKPLRVVFTDIGFVSDSVKINAEQIFKQISPTTEIKSI